MDELQSKRNRFSFSIANLLLLMIVIGFSLALVESRRQVASLEPKLKKLRLLARPLEVEDPERTHLIALPTGDRFTWQWRIKIPKGSKYFLGMSCGPFHDNGMPINPQMADAGIPEDETALLTVKLRPQKIVPESTQEQVMVSLKIQRGSDPTKMMTLSQQVSYFNIEMDEAMLFASRIRAPYVLSTNDSIDVAGLSEQEGYSIDEPIPLFRAKYGRADEVLIWLESAAALAKKPMNQGIAVPPPKSETQDAKN